MLCHSCTAFDIQRFAKSPTRTQGYSLQDTETASLQGCEFCSLLLEMVQDQISKGKNRYGSNIWIHLSMTEDYKIRRDSPTTSTKSRFNKLEISLTPCFPQSKGGDNLECLAVSHDLCVAADPESYAAMNGDVLGRYFGDHPDTDLHFAAIQRWLTECMNHRGCRQTLSQAVVVEGDVKLPTRCIDVMGATPYLRQTAGEWGAYTTLSHHWSSSTKTSSTTLQNLEQRRCAIDIDTLPTTLKHAIYITKRMGIRYVWVDSVYIIQDDGGADWEKEASCMADYYQLSTFTIAATASSKDRGCLFLRTPIIPERIVELPYRDSRRVQKGFFYVYCRDTDLVDEYKHSVIESPLLRRGWVFQEWALSRRIIYFTDTQVYFECQTCYPRNECQETIPIDLGAIGLSPIANSMLLKKSICAPSGNSVRVEDVWYKMVEHFSSLEITFPEKDRLLAIAGFANGLRHILLASSANTRERRIGTEPSRDYASGLWVRDIQHGLLWHHSGEKPARRSGCNTPSWSWASYYSPVQWDRRGTRARKICELISVQNDAHQPSGAELCHSTAQEQTDILLEPLRCVEVDASNSFTIIRMKGPLMPVLVGPIMDYEKRMHAKSWTEYEGTANQKCWRAVSNLKTPTAIMGWASIDRPAIQDQLSSYERTCIHALHIASRQVKRSDSCPSCNIHDILFLEKVGPNQYERLGVGRIWQDGFFVDAEIEELYLQ